MDLNRSQLIHTQPSQVPQSVPPMTHAQSLSSGSYQYTMHTVPMSGTLLSANTFNTVGQQTLPRQIFPSLPRTSLGAPPFYQLGGLHPAAPALMADPLSHPSYMLSPNALVQKQQSLMQPVAPG